MKNQFLLKLNKKHLNALTWFLDNHNKIVSWPDKLNNGDIVCTKAKAIYKPAWTKYALSVYETLASKYPDKAPKYRSDGTWRYEYYQEGVGIADFEKHYVNIALNFCIADKIPVGVMRQVSPKPESRYKVLGIALPVYYNNGYFILEGFNKEGELHGN